MNRFYSVVQSNHVLPEQDRTILQKDVGTVQISNNKCTQNRTYRTVLLIRLKFTNSGWYVPSRFLRPAYVFMKYWLIGASSLWFGTETASVSKLYHFLWLRVLGLESKFQRFVGFCLHFIFNIFCYKILSRASLLAFWQIVVIEKCFLSLSRLSFLELSVFWLGIFINGNTTFVLQAH